jgi:hypothetical protein
VATGRFELDLIHQTTLIERRSEGSNDPLRTIGLTTGTVAYGDGGSLWIAARDQ